MLDLPASPSVLPAAPGVARPRRGAGLACLALASAILCGCGESAPAPRKAPAPTVAGVRFEERAEASGLAFRMAFLPGEQGEHFKINFYDHGCGVAVADLEGDGDDDVYFCNQLGPNALFVNDGAGRFTDVTARAGVALDDRISVAAAFADYDGDGDQDLYVTTTRAGNVLFRNKGDGTFEDVTRAAGLELVAHSEQPVFFDADGDGDLDLLVTNTAAWTTEGFEPAGRYWRGNSTLVELVESPPEHDRFYLNRGDGTFEDATETAGLQGVGWSGDVAVFDADEDGDSDVFVCNMFGRSTLYVNDGTGVFRDGTAERLVRTPWGAVGAKAFDYSGDGRLDLFVVDMHSDMWMDFGADIAQFPEERKYGTSYGPSGISPQLGPLGKLRFDVSGVLFGNALYRAEGGGKFTELSDVAGVETMWPWGIAAADFDADGHQDAYVPTGMGYPFVYWRSPLLMNRGNGAFVDAAAAAGLDPFPGGRHQAQPIGGKPAARSARSAAVGDFDADGRPDLVVNLFNDRCMLFMNRSPARGWVGVRLAGAGRNRDAIGAVVRVKAGGRTYVRQVDAAGGYLAQSSRTLHFGLGDATRIDEVTVRWPDGKVETRTDLAPGRVHALRHPSAPAAAPK
ncbi:MAG: CRTAC1 family protein [Planctomycetia bacterium]|nr:CRTAC1 family protein [Planctomycetia bacterium]